MPKNKILLVDSDSENLRLYEISFRRAGLVTTTATDGADALKKLELFQPDLIVSEVTLPQMDGYEFCAEVKNDPRYRNIPFLFLTKEKSIENKVMGLELGADDYLVKPIFIKELITRVKMLIDRRDKEGMQVSGGKSLSGSLGEMEIVDLIQIMDMGVKSGTIQLTFEEEGEGKIYFRKGKISHVQYDRYTDMKAFSRILNRSRGEFNINFHEPEVEDTIELNTHEFVMEGMRWIDEWRGVLEGMPPLTSVLAVNSDLVLEANPDSEVFEGAGSLLSAFDGHKNISEIIDHLDQNDLEVLKKISHLYFEGYLIEVSPSELEEKKAEEEPPPKEFIELEEEISADDSIAHIFVEDSENELKEPSSSSRGKTLAEIEQQGESSPAGPPAGKPPGAEPDQEFFVEEEVEFEEEEPEKKSAIEFQPPSQIKLERTPEPSGQTNTATEPEEKYPAGPSAATGSGDGITVRDAEIGEKERFEWARAKPPPTTRPPQPGMSEEELWFLPPEDEARLAGSKKQHIEVIDRTPQRGVISAKKPTKIVSIIDDEPPQLPGSEVAETSETTDTEAPAPTAKKVRIPTPILIAAAVVGIFILGVGSAVLILKSQLGGPGSTTPTTVAQVDSGENTSPSTPIQPENTPTVNEIPPDDATALTPSPAPESPPPQPVKTAPAPQPESSPPPPRPKPEPVVKTAPTPAAPKPAPKPKPKPKPKPVRVSTPKKTVTLAKKPTTPAVSKAKSVTPAKPKGTSPPAKKTDPKQSRIYHARGKSYYQKGNLAKAVEDFAKAVNFNPRNAEAYYDLGVAYHDLGQTSNAIQALRWAVGLNLKNPEAYRLLGLLYQNIGDAKNSQIYFQKYITMLSE